jgi:hypothetical protein
MSSMIANVVARSGTARSSMELTSSQQTLLSQSGLDPSSDEYKQTALKMKVGNLENAVNLANELAQAFKKMREAAVQGMGR